MWPRFIAPCCTRTGVLDRRRFTRRRSTSSPSRARSVLWKFVGVYAFAIGYAAGAFAQLAIVYFAARSRARHRQALPECRIRWREILTKPAFFVVYAAGIGLNITFTRAYATHAGPGMAAALDYCMRGVAVPLALLVNPISNSLLPEIARLRSLFRLRDALRLIDKTIALAALVAVVGCGFALAFRQPGDRAALPTRQFHRGFHHALWRRHSSRWDRA